MIARFPNGQSHNQMNIFFLLFLFVLWVFWFIFPDTRTADLWTDAYVLTFNDNLDIACKEIWRCLLWFIAVSSLFHLKRYSSVFNSTATFGRHSPAESYPPPISFQSMSCFKLSLTCNMLRAFLVPKRAVLTSRAYQLQWDLLQSMDRDCKLTVSFKFPPSLQFPVNHNSQISTADHHELQTTGIHFHSAQTCL